MLSYKKVFNPGTTEKFADAGGAPGAPPAESGDRRDGSVYVYDEEIVLAVNVALTTSRPLLIRGPSGSGKSSLARNVARFLGWRYYEEVISSRTQARDLLWNFDALRRLSDAQAGGGVKPDVFYVEPGVLWWAFDRESARRRGLTPKRLEALVPGDARADFLARDPEEKNRHGRAVVLLDEIDKADPDTPNNLLVPLGSLLFYVPEAKARVKARQAPLVIITSNDERELPGAFLRRCVMLSLKAPGLQRLSEIAAAHFGEEHRDLYTQVARRVVRRRSRGAEADASAEPPPSAAEFLDTVRACLELRVNPKGSDRTWRALSKATLWKSREGTEAV